MQERLPYYNAQFARYKEELCLLEEVKKNLEELGDWVIKHAEALEPAAWLRDVNKVIARVPGVASFPISFRQGQRQAIADETFRPIDYTRELCMTLTEIAPSSGSGVMCGGGFGPSFAGPPEEGDDEEEVAPPTSNARQRKRKSAKNDQNDAQKEREPKAKRQKVSQNVKQKLCKFCGMLHPTPKCWIAFPHLAPEGFEARRYIQRRFEKNLNEHPDLRALLKELGKSQEKKKEKNED